MRDAAAARGTGSPARRSAGSACSCCCGWSSRRSRPRRAGRRAWPAARRSSPRSNAGRPSQPARFAAWGRAISDAPYPSALGTLQSPPNPGPPPGTSITAAVDARVRASTVMVDGRACDEIQEGSGWVAAPGLVVTNAHVVAGEQHDDRRRHATGAALPATVDRVRPDARRRGARVPGARARRAARRWRPARSATVGAVYGHPGGGAAPGVTGAHRRRDPRGRHRHLPHGLEPPARVRARGRARARRLRRRARRHAGAGDRHGVRHRSRPRARPPTRSPTPRSGRCCATCSQSDQRTGRHRPLPRRLNAPTTRLSRLSYSPRSGGSPPTVPEGVRATRLR